MKAIVLNGVGDVDQLVYQNVDIPNLESEEVLVKVKSISINPVDVKTREGHGIHGLIKTEQPIILGWDIAGVVEKTNSSAFKEGDEVFGMVNFPGLGKAYAEYVAAPANQLALKPSHISFEEAAASTLVGLTVWQALVTNANVQKGQKVLVHAAAGGVGHVAVQIAKYLGAEVTGTSSLKNKDFVFGLGTDHYIDYHSYDWNAHPSEFDFVLDTIGGENIENSIGVTKSGGSIISIPTGLSEALTEKAAAKGIKGYNILVKSNGNDMQKIAELLADETIKIHIAKQFVFEEMRDAHQQISTGRTVGKVVVNL